LGFKQDCLDISFAEDFLFGVLEKQGFENTFFCKFNASNGDLLMCKDYTCPRASSLKISPDDLTAFVVGDDNGGGDEVGWYLFTF